MRTTIEAAARATSPTERLTASSTPANTTPTSPPPNREAATALLAQVMAVLDDAKAENIVSIDLLGKSSIGDYMVITSGRSDRHVGAIGDQLLRKLKEQGVGRMRAEGMETCDWVLIDIGDVIVHIFRPEVREFYKLEKMWTGERPGDETAH